MAVDSGMRLWRELAREAAGSFVFMGIGPGVVTVLAIHVPGWSTLLIAAGLAVGQMAGIALTPGSRLRISPAASLLLWRRGEISGRLTVASAAVQVAAMTLAAAVVTGLTGATSRDLIESTSSLTRTAVVVGVASAIWFTALIRQPPIWGLGLVYFALHLGGLPLDSGSLNPARTLAPVLLGGSGASLGALAAFGLVPLAVAAVMGRKQ